MLGQVGSSGVLSQVDCNVGFRLQPPPAGARILSAGLRCALLNEAAGQRGRGRAGSAFTADLGKLARAEDKVGCCPGPQPAADMAPLPSLQIQASCSPAEDKLLFSGCLSALAWHQPPPSTLVPANDKAHAAPCLALLAMCVSQTWIRLMC